MSWPPARPYAGPDKRGDVAFHTILAVLGTAGVLWGLHSVPPEQVWLRAMIFNGFWGVGISVALVAEMVVRTQLPVMRRAVLDGEPAYVVRTWNQQWWHTCAFDLGLLLTGVGMVVAGLVVGGQEGRAALVVAPLGLWFHVRFVLVVLRRRRPRTLWLTPDEVVLDTPSGRARAPRASVSGVRADDGDRLVLTLREPAVRELCPRPWRERGSGEVGTLVLDCTHSAHDAEGLAVWLRTRLADGALASPSSWARRAGHPPLP